MFTGGEQTATVDIYDSSTTSWLYASLSSKRWNGVSAVSVGTLALFAGGANSSDATCRLGEIT